LVDKSAVDLVVAVTGCPLIRVSIIGMAAGQQPKQRKEEQISEQVNDALCFSER